MTADRSKSPEEACRKVNIIESLNIPRYAICTVVTRPEEYRLAQQSFIAHGFTREDTSYLWVDNSGDTNRLNAFEAYNAFLVLAQSRYIILCHQDVLLLQDGRERLDTVLTSLQDLDPNWALCGNAGVREDGVLALRLTDPHGSDRLLGGPLPVRVTSLDENFIVVRRAANLAVSHDLTGFHMYGTDLCLIADVLGWSSYVVDFHLHHKSGGNTDQSFYESLTRLQSKYRRAFRTRWVQLPTLRPAFISGAGRGLHALAHRLRRLGLPRRLDPSHALQANASNEW